ncbi:hypothetical protein ENUP19_0266G0042 [Entamoeba nuttalli]|uniref:Uncharacterized protein n=2 Tax=Entamoeba nuttalli TaxID=412467 RepID=K2HCE1_ENTNP|nr:hypothetical protein ENU1_091520 [Entamoeba nuttalli P19]EKE40404.1 hypothetical protein ENU1_091520 [Entamoeba nuttalli P19]|eukprot:XP_008857262.1 hypothetical protein ENU1_091520 [Entamoeba nuttalli P19]
MNWKFIIKNIPLLLISSICIFFLLVILPNVHNITQKELTQVVSESILYNSLFIFSLIIIIPLIFGLSYLIHFIFIPHFVAMVNPVVVPCKGSSIALFCVGTLLLIEIFIQNASLKNIFHTLSLICYIIHVGTYYYIVRLCPFTMSFIRSRIQSVKVILTVSLIMTLLCKLILKGTIAILSDWLSILLAIIIASCYYKDIKEFVVNYYNDVESQNNVETLTDLDPLTMKELEEPSDVVII